MSPRRRLSSRCVIGLASWLLLCVAGCARGTGRVPYARCNSAMECLPGILCEGTNAGTGSAYPAAHCTMRCSVDGPDPSCPSAPDGSQGICVPGARGGQCYRGCPRGNECEQGYRCTVPGVSRSAVCVPAGGSTPSCGGVDQVCCAGMTCTASTLACVGGTCKVACGGEGQQCCNGSDCSEGLQCSSGMCQTGM